jgi:NAD(P)-dependent dehydrogenase (short-subunit alcohol dehydrogenase family)
MKHIVITGVSRGIGEKLLELSLERGDKLCGIARHPEKSEELTRLSQKYKDQLILMKGDVTDKSLGQKILKELKWPAIDLIINNAGIYRDDEWKDFEETFVTNSIAPYFLTKELFPLLRKSADPKAAFITSQMGSIDDNSSGGSVSYRASKSALNMIVKCLSIDEPWLTSLLYHPGWVRTDMGGKQAPTETHESAEGLLKCIHQSVKKDSGTFRNFKGNTIRW